MKVFDETIMSVAEKLDERKAQDIVIMDVSQATIIAETFIICSGTSPNQVRMLAEEAEKKMMESGRTAKRIEGFREGRWIVVDFGDVLIHVFHRDERKFYDIERLWKTEGNYLNYEPVIPEKKD